MPSSGPDGEDRSVLTREARQPDAVWRYGRAPAQVADIYLPGQRTGCPVLLVHGGFWRPEYDRSHLRPLAQALADAGHPVASLEYGRLPGHPDAAVADLVLALDALATRPPVGWPPAPGVLVGHSAGGHLALLLAATEPPNVREVVALAPVADLARAEDLGLDQDAVVAFLGDSASTRPDLDPARGVPTVPVTVLHGTRDSLVPIALTHSYASSVSGAPSPGVAGAGRVRVRSLSDTGHFELIDPESDAFVELLSVLSVSGIE